MERWVDKKWFGRLNKATGKEDAVSWKQLSWRDKCELLKALVLMGYILPTALAGAGGALERLYNHVQSSVQHSSGTATDAPTYQLENENGQPVVYVYPPSWQSEDPTYPHVKITLPPEIQNIIREQENVSTKGWDTTVTREPVVRESPAHQDALEGLDDTQSPPLRHHYRSRRNR